MPLYLRKCQKQWLKHLTHSNFNNKIPNGSFKDVQLVQELQCKGKKQLLHFKWSVTKNHVRCFNRHTALPGKQTTISNKKTTTQSII
jgi:hypothetical protein